MRKEGVRAQMSRGRSCGREELRRGLTGGEEMMPAGSGNAVMVEEES